MKKNASSYCNYNDSFTEYDQLRRPNGLNELLHLFRRSGVPVKGQEVLEGGFGTGAYIDYIRHHVKKIYGVEGSEEGLRRARQKCADAANVYLQRGNILNLTFSENSFDAYMVNQVLHHLDSEPGYPNVNVFLQHGRRVLRPGGMLTINTSTQEQLDPHTGVFWNYTYIEKAARRMQARFIPVEVLADRLKNYGFTDITITIPEGELFQIKYYKDPSVALQPDFQKGDSVYCFLCPEELEQANLLIAAAVLDGTVHEEMERAAQRRAKIGEAVIISARKPPE